MKTDRVFGSGSGITISWMRRFDRRLGDFFALGFFFAI